MARTRSKKTKNNDITDIVTAVKVIKLNPKLIGALFLSLGMIVFLSIISYDRTDIATWSSLNEFLIPNQKKNWLGIVGANIAHTFFMYTMGYASIIFPVWFSYIGLQFLKQKEKNIFYHPKLLLLLNVAFFVSLLLAFPESYRTIGKTVDYYPSGLIGGLSMDLIIRLFGKTGSLIVLSCYSLTLVLLYLPKMKLINLFTKIKSKLKLPKLILDREKDIDSEIDGTSEENIVDNSAITEKKIEEEKELTVVPYRELSYDKELEEFQEGVDGHSEEIHFDQEKFRKSEEKIDNTVKKLVDERKIETQKEVLTNDEVTYPINQIQEENISKEELIPEPVLQKSDKVESDSELENLIGKIQESGISKSKTTVPLEEKLPEEEKEEHVVDFNIEEEIHEKESNLDKVQKKLSKRERYIYPSVDFLEDPTQDQIQITEDELWASAKLLEDKLTDFKVDAKVVNVICGPVITMYELRPAQGVRLGKIESLMDDIALNMSARGIRYLGQLSGKDTIGIEIPNIKPNMVYFKDIINSEKFVKSKYELPVALGKAVNGEIVIWDLADMPHLLVAGATGSGKSVGLNSLIASLLYRKHPDDLKFIMIDPKMLELGLYNDLINHHLAYSKDLDEKVITKPDNAVAILHAVVEEMERRYRYLANCAVRNIKEYNRKVAGTLVDPADPESEKHPKLPYIVVIVDELADLMITAGKEIEEPIARLTQKARAIGIHCIIATQRPSVDVITGVIKANIPTRIAFQTASKIDSRTILDLMGAEQLLGKGDMLFLPPGQAKAMRIQNAFLSTEEIEEIVKHIKKQEFAMRLDLPLVQDEKSTSGYSSPFKKDGESTKRDALFEEAKTVIVLAQQGSISLLQRKLSIGYARAAKIVDQLEEEGIVGPYNGSNAREVLMQPEELEGF